MVGYEALVQFDGYPVPGCWPRCGTARGAGRAGRGGATSNMRINLDTPVRDAALRVITRTGSEWARPLLCIDNAGRYVGVVRVQRLLHALSTD